jgi:lysine/ornithine N-monooxygenase
MDSQPSNDQKIIVDLQAKLEKANRELAHYARVNNALSSALSELGIKVWHNSQVSVVASAEVKAKRDLIEKGKHMTVLHNAIKSNTVVADGWKKFMFTLRLCGFDNSDNQESN